MLLQHNLSSLKMCCFNFHGRFSKFELLGVPGESILDLLDLSYSLSWTILNLLVVPGSSILDPLGIPGESIVDPLTYTLRVYLGPAWCCPPCRRRSWSCNPQVAAGRRVLAGGVKLVRVSKSLMDSLLRHIEFFRLWQHKNIFP